MLLRFFFADQCQCTLTTLLMRVLLNFLVLQTTGAELLWNQHRYRSFALYQHTPQPESTRGFQPIHLEILEDCAFGSNISAKNTTHGTLSPLSNSLLVVVSWDEAITAGCYSYAQYAQNLYNAETDFNDRIQGILFGSVTDDNVQIGSPISEPYGDIKAVDTKHWLVLTDASTVQMLLASIVSPTVKSQTLQIVQEPGPWNRLVQTPGFKTQKYLFLAFSIVLIFYTFWEMGLMLCTMTIWNRRMLMYLSATGYLVVFALLHPYHLNSRASQMVVYSFWIIGYTSFTLFIIAWGSMVEKIHTHIIFVLRHHRKVHYAAAVLVSISILLKLWAFAAESYQFSAVMDTILLYEMPVVLAIQITLLCVLIVLFLCRTFGIAISNYTKLVLRNVAMLCVVALLGCLCLLVLGVNLLTNARYTTEGYLSIIILYNVGQCLLFVAIFGALWVRDYAKRTRPLFNHHEFYIRIDSQQQLRRNQTRCSCTHGTDTANGYVNEPMRQPSPLSMQRYQFNYCQLESNHGSCHELQISTQEPNTENEHVASPAVNCHTLMGTAAGCATKPLSLICTFPTGPSYEPLDEQQKIHRKRSKRHVYVPLEPTSARIMQNSVVANY